jgi:5-formyltetrahydrofolate cyclo-ligase
LPGGLRKILENDIIIKKVAARERFSEILAKIPQYLSARKSEEIARKFLKMPEYAAAKTVVAYASFGAEVATHELIKQVLRDKGKIILPRCDAESREILPFEITNFSQLSPKFRGILEPTSSAKLITNKNLIDIIIVPGLSFCADGRRIGYGGGYYDRFLADFVGVSVGFCFLECKSENLPTDSRDIAVQKVIFA